MKRGISARSVALFFVLVVALYLAIFYGIEFLNHRSGPWEVSFMSDAAGNPAIAVYQPKLNISAVEIILSDEKVAPTNLSQRVSFDQHLKPIPFGEVIYDDLRALPGVVTFNLLGHEIELLPRVLIVNKREVPWKSDSTLELSATNKPAQPPKPPKSGR